MSLERVGYMAIKIRQPCRARATRSYELFRSASAVTGCLHPILEWRDPG